MEYFNQSQTDWRIAQCCQWHDKALAKRYNIGTTTKTYALKEGGKERVQSKAYQTSTNLLMPLKTISSPTRESQSVQDSRLSYFLVIHWISLMNGMMRLGMS